MLMKIYFDMMTKIVLAILRVSAMIVLSAIVGIATGMIIEYITN
jgi:hypothetical protein